jgi:SAM-dependent methyltransferase/methyltransferase-like protein
MAERTLYDIVPYPSKAYAHAHPDRLCVMGRLFGLATPDVRAARVLEIGCGEGGHLLPMAAHLPGAHVTGIDLASEAIAIARQRALDAGLSNVRFEVADVTTVDPAWLGTFDYIVSHGVYSWIPEAAREGLMRLVQATLSPLGVAYISYNAFPGWHMHRVARDIMRVHAEGFDEPLEQARQGMAILRFFAEHSPERSPYGQVLRQQAAMTERYSDAYFFHDLLSPVNEPLLLRDFVAQARDAKLAYLGDADLGLMMTTHLPAEVRATLDKVSHDLIALEQHLDLLRGTSFRRTLLCHPHAQLSRELGPDRLAGLWVSMAGKPREQHVDLQTDDPAVFDTYDLQPVTVTDRIGKAALIRLSTVHPRSLPVRELFDLATAWAATPEGDPVEFDKLAGVLLHSFAVGLIDLLPRDRGEPEALPERPEVERLARVMAAAGEDSVANRRHEMVPLTRMDTVLIGLCDGTRDEAALLDALCEACADGRLTVKVEGEPTLDAEVIRDAMGKALPDRLDRLRRTSLLRVPG